MCDCQGGDSRAARARLVCVFPNHFGARTPKEWKKSYREMTTCPPVVKACRGCVSEHAHSRDCDAMCMKCARTHQKCAHALGAAGSAAAKRSKLTRSIAPDTTS